MDELVALAIVAALGNGDYREAGLIAFFLLISELIESRTAIGARASIEELIKLTPKKARLINPDGSETTVDATALKTGQIVRVLPGDNIPADGKVKTGESTVNQANITGESLPVDKRLGDPVFSGTTNLTGALELEVTKVGSDTTLGQVQRLILDAERTRNPIMRIIDRYVAWYTPIVLMLAGLVLFFTKDDNGIERAISMLVVSCPCALIMPTIELQGVLTVIPVANIVILMRELFLGNFEASTVALCLISTCFYAAAAVVTAARIYGNESVLFSDVGSYKTLLQRKFLRPAAAPSASFAILLLAVLFPINFYVQSSLGDPMAGWQGLAKPVVVTQLLLFAATPIFLAWYMSSNESVELVYQRMLKLTVRVGGQ